ncbi:hypothetical protein BDV98DRAFT_539087 [Pterulicium gracile]|uniref:Uncharacterized protein n=1 Tax=Pterulicium gracile TaxID=1884261 RepID=A0A5C3R7P8_9AGAR|nr:hypothetical protein BDV98DRAFT_539087 [Pterula gracilis]
MSNSYQVKQFTDSVIPKKGDKFKRHHGFAVFLFIAGTLLPPVAVAARFGFGMDFCINVVMTLLGYFPGHGHNFYIQNIRNNKNHRRTPKWAQRYGLVDTTDLKRQERKSQWANRYKDRLPQSTLEGQPLAEGQEGSSSVDLSNDSQHARRATTDNSLWRPEDESYYGAKSSEDNGSRRWHYPANFEEAMPIDEPKPKKKKKKDRWERTEDAYSHSDERSKKKKKKKGSSRSIASESINSREMNFPEDAEGGLYGDRRAANPAEDRRTSDTDLNHQF